MAVIINIIAFVCKFNHLCSSFMSLSSRHRQGQIYRGWTASLETLNSLLYNNINFCCRKSLDALTNVKVLSVYSKSLHAAKTWIKLLCFTKDARLEREQSNNHIKCLIFRQSQMFHRSDLISSFYHISVLFTYILPLQVGFDRDINKTL